MAIVLQTMQNPRTAVYTNFRLFGCVVAAGLALFVPARGAATDESVAVDDESPAVERPASAGFSFGSYGRIMAGSDLQGGRAKPVEVASFGPRLIESPYVELDLSYRVEADSGARFRTLLTLGVSEALFHFNGRFDSAITLRNAYVAASHFGAEGLEIWAGSRMLRGDDIYLLDFWPLDELNTVGGGASLQIAGNTTISAHGGVNQLNDRFQYQEIEVSAPDFGTEAVILLDRVRALASLRVEHVLPEVIGDVGMKFVVYGDYQAMGAGVYEDDGNVRIDLPSELGWTAGAQIGAWGFTQSGFANLFFRVSGGLAAYDELAIPRGVDIDLSVASARLVRGGLSLNAESRYVGATAAAYVQSFRDGDGIALDRDDYTEGVFVVRPVIFATRHFHQVFEASYQRRAPRGLSPRTDTYLEAAAWQFGIMPTLTLERAVYARPQIRLMYVATLLNEGARDRWPTEDVRNQRSVQHYLGVGAEWWFNSSSYQ